MEQLTPDAIRDKFRESLIEAAVAILVEAALLRVAAGLKGGPPRKPGRRFVRRALGAVLSELVAEGVAMSYAQRRRARAAIDLRLERERQLALPLTLGQIPTQRTSTEERAGAAPRTATS